MAFQTFWQEKGQVPSAVDIEKFAPDMLDSDFPDIADIMSESLTTPAGLSRLESNVFILAPSSSLHGFCKAASLTQLLLGGYGSSVQFATDR
jgi:hypothetical protein